MILDSATQEGLEIVEDPEDAWQTHDIFVSKEPKGIYGSGDYHIMINDLLSQCRDEYVAKHVGEPRQGTQRPRRLLGSLA